MDPLQHKLLSYFYFVLLETFDQIIIEFRVFSKVYLVKGQGSGLTGDRDYYDNSGNDQAFINFDLQADLSPLFNWNVKALYLYLTAEYITKENSLNEMVLWDKIVMNGEKMELDMKSAKVSHITL